MKLSCLVIVFLFSSILFSNMVNATPLLHDPQPSNNVYIGGGTKTLSINITENSLNAGSVLLYIISQNAYQQGDSWDNYTMPCANTTNEWKCSKTISFAIAGSDTIELFYFQANDTNGVTGYDGNSTSPLIFTLDRNPPVISFSSPVNNSYVSGNQTISITVTDAASGVNNNTVKYSLDNSQWNTINNVSMNSFQKYLDTTIFSNNQTLTLYVNASDNVNNNASTNINVMVDNEIPDIKIISPSPTVLSGNAQLTSNVSDYYSGVNLAKVLYNVESMSGSLGCTGTRQNSTCSAVLPTSSLQDGNHTIVFTVTDNAGNSKSANVTIRTINSQPFISITQPKNNAVVGGTALVQSTLANTGVVNYVGLSVESPGNNITKNMTCDINFTSCSYPLDTITFADGGYTIRARAINNLNSDIFSTITAVIDNTKPKVTITEPVSDVSGDFTITASIIDVNLNQSRVGFILSSFAGNMTCTPQTPSSFLCSTSFNSRQLNDGRYTLSISAEDKAGNIDVESKNISVVNLAGASSSASSSPSNNATVNSGSSSSTGNPSTGITGIENEKTTQTSGITLPVISLTLTNDYIILITVLAAITAIVIIIAIIVRTKLSRNIIRE
ncbi:MAG: hypothetical protein HYW23_04105 [Candidatus Aenigmarchaeota archaeon]|nr:hypothetical protein [Candidatus Aenigmarchaeota archaeon]